MKKINSYYTDYQIECLQELSATGGTKVSELLRRAVDMYIERMIERGLLIDPNERFELKKDDGLPEAIIEDVEGELS